MLEVNEYVRTDKGYIFKVDEEKKNLQIANFLDVEYGKMIKHSKQLIDLIEVGDVLEIRTGLYSSFKYFVENEDNLLLLEDWYIETILTKEQFEANCYKVGEEEQCM